LSRVQRPDSLDFAHIDSEHAKPLIARYDLQNVDSVIVISRGKASVKSEAVIKIIARIRWPYRGLYILVIIPKFIRDWMYDIVARNREKWFGRSTELTCEFLIDGGESRKDKPK